MSRLVLTVISVLCVGACAQIPDLGPVHHPRSIETYDSKQTFDAHEGDWPTTEWWRAYGDDQLNLLIVEALEHAPSIAQATARLREAQFRAGLADAAQLPKVDLNASADEEKLSYKQVIPSTLIPKGWHDFGHTTLDFSWEIDFWGKNRKSFDAAKFDVEAEAAEHAAATVLLTTSVVEAYAQLQDLFVIRDLAQEATNNRDASAKLVSSRFDQGLDTQANLAEANERANEAAADLAAVDEQVLLSRNALAALVGQGPDRGLLIQRCEFSNPHIFGLPSRLALDLLGRKPEIVAARWRVEAAAKRIGVSRTAFYPNVNLIAYIGFDSLGLKNLYSSGAYTGSVGPAVQLPIFDGGRLRANYGIANAQYSLAVAQYDESIAQSLHEAADAVRSIQLLGPRLSSTDAALAESEKAYHLAKRRYQEGVGDFQSVLTAEDTVIRVRQTDTTLRASGVLHDVALIKALGGGFTSDPQLQAEATR